MEITAALALGRRLLREHGLDDWRLVADHAKTRAGVCRFRTRTISLSRPLTALHDEDLVRDTILHEIAHALVGPEHGHDATWRATARRIGCSGERLVASDAPRVEGHWRGVCPVGHEVTRHRQPTRVVSCSQCWRTFSPAHLLTWTYKGRSVAMSQAYQQELAALRRRHPVPDRGGAAPGAVSAAGNGTGTSSATGMSSATGTSTGQGRRGARDAVIRIGARVVVVSGGRLHGHTGEVEAVHDTRCQVRVGNDLYLIPHDLLELADSLAS